MMNRYVPVLFVLFLHLLIPATLGAGPEKQVIAIKVSGVINPVSSEFITKSVREANEKRAEALVIELDTPGGLDTSMRSIVKEIINSNVPVVVYVSPGGARAASAGAFITIAAHIAAMAARHEHRGSASCLCRRKDGQGDG